MIFSWSFSINFLICFQLQYSLYHLIPRKFIWKQLKKTEVIQICKWNTATRKLYIKMSDFAHFANFCSFFSSPHREWNPMGKILTDAGISCMAWGLWKWQQYGWTWFRCVFVYFRINEFSILGNYCNFFYNWSI